jgi:RhoGEF domain
MPIQRIPRYELLLRDLLKRTWENHPDYKDLVEAREKIQGVGKMLNEKKREAENMTSLIQASQRIQGKLKVELTESHRRFIREQKLVDGKEIDMVVFLFNDCMITSRPTLKSKISSKSLVKFRVRIHPSSILCACCCGVSGVWRSRFFFFFVPHEESFVFSLFLHHHNQ